MPQMSQVLRERAIGMLTAGMSTRDVDFSTISHLKNPFREFGSTSKPPHNVKLMKLRIISVCNKALFVGKNILIGWAWLPSGWAWLLSG
jgi:hypothetical protein